MSDPGPEPPPRPDSVQGPRGPWPLATWRPAEALPVFLLALFGGALLAVLLFGVVDTAGGRFVAAATAGEVATLVTVCAWVRGVHRTPLSALGIPGRPWRTVAVDVAIGAVLGVALIFASQVVLEGIRWVGEQLVGHPLAEPEQVPPEVRGAALAVLGPVVILAAPLAEESFFRGFLYQGLRRRHSVWTSGALSSVLFGLAHFTGTASLQLLLPLAVVGLGFALAYERRRSLLVSVCAHAAFNVFGYLSVLAGR